MFKCILWHIKVCKFQIENAILIPTRLKIIGTRSKTMGRCSRIIGTRLGVLFTGFTHVGMRGKSLVGMRMFWHQIETHQNGEGELFLINSNKSRGRLSTNPTDLNLIVPLPLFRFNPGLI